MMVKILVLVRACYSNVCFSIFFQSRFDLFWKKKFKSNFREAKEIKGPYRLRTDLLVPINSS